jgi:uncharacterized protein (UPF0332 family)
MNNFLSKLNAEGKLQLTEPSDDIKTAYLKKSESYLGSAKLLIQNNKVEESVSMAYYSMYYTLLALLFKVGIKCENHTAAILLLKELFNQDNSKIEFAKKERIDKQYYVDFTLGIQDATQLITLTEEFNAEIYDTISKITNETTNETREKLQNLIT